GPIAEQIVLHQRVEVELIYVRIDPLPLPRHRALGEEVKLLTLGGGGAIKVVTVCDEVVVNGLIRDIRGEPGLRDVHEIDAAGGGSEIDGRDGPHDEGGFLR